MSEQALKKLDVEKGDDILDVTLPPGTRNPAIRNGFRLIPVVSSGRIPTVAQYRLKDCQTARRARGLRTREDHRARVV